MEHPENDEAYKGLKVNKGVENVPTVNPYLKRRVQRKQYTTSEFVEGILKGNITVLSQAVTMVESSKHSHQQLAQEIIEKCLPFAGKSVRIGITGVPGAGKSTSIDSFGMHLLKQGHKLAVLAIDPSSERSKGSILGDKTRMEALSREKNASFALRHRLVRWEEWLVRLVKQLSCVKLPDLILFLWRRSESGKVKRRFIPWWTFSF